MSYSIFTVYYGVPLEHPGPGFGYPDSIEQALENEETGFNRHYSGSASRSPSCFGLDMDKFDECAHHIDVSTLKLEPSKKQLADYQALFATLDPQLQADIKERFGEPRVFFLVSTS